LPEGLWEQKSAFEFPILGLNQAYGAPAGDDIADLYRYAADTPAALVPTPAGAATLGVVPERFADFVARHEWSMPAA